MAMEIFRSRDLNGRLTEVDNAGTPNLPNVVLNYDYNAVGNHLSVTDTIDGQLAHLFYISHIQR